MLRYSPRKQVGTEYIVPQGVGLTNLQQAIIALFYHHTINLISPMRTSSVTLHRVLRTIMLARIAAGTPRHRAKMWPLRTRLFLTSLQPVVHIR